MGGGDIVGLFVIGAAVGDGVGAIVGGPSVGAAVGLVGPLVGLTVGGVGAPVGCFVVGAGVGNSVGCSVGGPSVGARVGNGVSEKKVGALACSTLLQRKIFINTKTAINATISLYEAFQRCRSTG